MKDIVGSQERTFWLLYDELRPEVARDRDLANRLQRRLSSERRFGSRDRRIYRELLYTALRFLPWVEELRPKNEALAFRAVVWLSAPIPALEPLRAARLGGFPETGPSLAERAAVLGARAALLPGWCADECPDVLRSPDLEAVHRRAPLWLRLQTSDPGPVFDEFTSRGWTWRVPAVKGDALEVLSEADVTQCESFRRGLFEVQDLGSQLILEAVPLAPGGRWLDACAGAGGKTLQLAWRLGPRGAVDAHDIREGALAELRQRAQRARFPQIRVTRAPGSEYDGVLVDAPCSGSGTWRRAPHLKYSTTSEEIRRAAAVQGELLERFSEYVRPGGLVVYATCSLCLSENRRVVESFLTRHPSFSAQPPVRDLSLAESGPGFEIRPATHNSDGFYVALLRRAAVV